jgi:hypothetical protein
MRCIGFFGYGVPDMLHPPVSVWCFASVAGATLSIFHDRATSAVASASGFLDA